jgi:hypothetical protein
MQSVMKMDALMSPCGLFRYTLRRTWNEARPKALLIGLNPSTADHRRNDPTVTREIAFAMSWHCGTLLKGNLFAFRATDPKDMRKAVDPIGPENDKWLLEMFSEADIVVCAWGVGGAFMRRDLAVAQLLRGKPLKCLGVTKDSHPKHPLYLKATTPLMDWAG